MQMENATATNVTRLKKIYKNAA